MFLLAQLMVGCSVHMKTDGPPPDLPALVDHVVRAVPPAYEAVTPPPAEAADLLGVLRSQDGVVTAKAVGIDSRDPPENQGSLVVALMRSEAGGADGLQEGLSLSGRRFKTVKLTDGSKGFVSETDAGGTILFAAAGRFMIVIHTDPDADAISIASSVARTARAESRRLT
jgi:hypothetical protein